MEATGESVRRLKTKISTFGLAVIATFALAANAEVIHVATSGYDTAHGTESDPFRTIQHAADIAEPGDVVIVHAGVYRERIDPPRGGESDTKRITFQAAPAEKVVITGSEIARGWTKVTNDTWKTTIPNSYFGKFNPYADVIHGDWFVGNGRMHHTGAVYLNGDWLVEAASHLNEVLAPVRTQRLWFAHADGVEDADYLLNIAAIIIGDHRVEADSFAEKNGELHAANYGDPGRCIGWIRAGSPRRATRENEHSDEQELASPHP